MISNFDIVNEIEANVNKTVQNLDKIDVIIDRIGYFFIKSREKIRIFSQNQLIQF